MSPEQERIGEAKRKAVEADARIKAFADLSDIELGALIKDIKFGERIRVVEEFLKGLEQLASTHGYRSTIKVVDFMAALKAGLSDDHA